jgi:serine/threonine-protein kinase
MGVVYKARDRRLKRVVAIKILPPELAYRSEIRSRFLREAETAAQLSHPNIVPIYSVDEREGLVFFVMAFVDGENLAARLHRAGPMKSDEVRRVLIDVGHALAYAHGRGVVHRDIKPDNILIQGSDGRVLVTDFGIARAITEGSEARLTATGMAIGTPAYMSPEQSTGEREVDGRSDLYSLGIVGYQMLSGALPFHANSTPALLVKQLSEAPPPIQQRCPDVAPDLGRAIMVLLEKDPAHRFPTAAALAAALESRQVPEPTGPPPGPRPLAPRREAPAVTATGPAELTVSGADLDRWNQPQVRAFRRKVRPWLFWGGVSIVLKLFGVVDLVGLWGFYTLYMAWKYAKLWTDGFDWRDVLKEPRDRLLLDVIAEWTDNVKALWDPQKRNEVRERARLRGGSPLVESPADRAALPGPLAPNEPATRGTHGDLVRAAARNRDEVVRLVETLPKSDRAQLSDVPASASELYRRVEALALAVVELERNAPRDLPLDLDGEIARLEAEANPLDVDRSEERVRRLALLKRQRRTVADLAQRRRGHQERLESCALALENMRLDVLRLRSGSQTFEHITTVAERAVALAQEVDTAMYVKDEMSKLGRRSAGSAGR